jgi:DNA-binding beta-propeller fold protein YncE
MSRAITIAGAVVLGALLLASLAFGRAARAGGDVSIAACASGSVSARIAGTHRCLRAGQRCRKRYDRQYHRYGFHCHTGRLSVKLPSAGKVVATIRLHVGPLGAVSANGAVWVAEHNAGTVARIDPATNKVVARVSIPSGEPARLAVGPEGLWHLPYYDNTLQELDPATNSVSAHITSIGEPDENCCSPAVGAGSVWVPKAHDGVYRIDAASREVVAHVPIDNFFGSVFGFGSLWGISGGDVFRLEPATNSIAARIAVPGLAKVAIEPGCCPALGLGPGAVWVGLGKKVARIDPSTNSVAALIRVPGTVDLLTSTDDGVWAVGTSASSTTTLWRISPTANKVVASLSLSRTEAADVITASRSLWITLMRDNKLLRVEPAAIPAG